MKKIDVVESPAFSDEDPFERLEKLSRTLKGQVNQAKSGLDVTMRPSARVSAFRTIGEIQAVLERIVREL